MTPTGQDPQAVTRDLEPADHAMPAHAVASDRGSLPEPATAAHATARLLARKQVKVLFFAANADRDRWLAVGREHDAIQASIHASRYRDHVQLITRLTGRLSDLHQALLDHSPDIVHFACHGSAQAELLLMQDGGGTVPVPAAALSETLRVLRDNLILVVFNACFSSTQAAAIRDSVGLAIGMGRPIEDPAAIAFSSELYRALASGRSVQDAFDLGVAAIKASAGNDPMPRLSAGEGIAAREVRLAPGALRRWPRLWPWILIAASCMALALAVVPRLLRRSDPPPPPGMVRFAAADVRMGVFAPGSRPQECSALTASEDCAAREPLEQVRGTHVASFDLDRMEVTNGEFAAWLNANTDRWRPPDEHGIVTTRREPAIPLVRTKKCGDGLTITPEGHAQVTAEAARWPVVCVTWHGADEYCRAQGERLPLEAEWELAAKGAEARPFPWGADLPRQDGVAFDLRDGAQVHPRAVGDSPQDVTPDGVHDLGGNVAEWVEDRRGHIEQKTFRGGSFASRGPCHLLSSGCRRAAGDGYHKDVGFRCARSVIDRP
jgi:formylglycine-generating enzyme required for sulfatase activity